jgi:hypothetical protein
MPMKEPEDDEETSAEQIILELLLERWLRMESDTEEVERPPDVPASPKAHRDH